MKKGVREGDRKEKVGREEGVSERREEKGKIRIIGWKEEKD